MIRFSIITITRNDVIGIVRTLQSVFAQTYQNFEIIVQDGASTDGTSAVLRDFGDWIDDLAIEPDEGIYDAMNKALRRATGDYCIFMNSSDCFANPEVLEKVAQRINAEVHDIWSGLVLDNDTGVVHNYWPEDEYWIGMTFCHQAVFIRTSLMQALEYDTAYRICADLHFFGRARKAGASFKSNDLVISRMPLTDGVSSDFVDCLIDRFDMLDREWGDTFPVRERITQRLAEYLQKSYDLPKDQLADLSIDEMLALHRTMLPLQRA